MDKQIDLTKVHAAHGQVKQNAMFDQEGGQNESLVHLRKSRRAAQGNVTKKIAKENCQISNYSWSINDNLIRKFNASLCF